MIAIIRHKLPLEKEIAGIPQLPLLAMRPALKIAFALWWSFYRKGTDVRSITASGKPEIKLTVMQQSKCR
jgi:hypothetical protein